MDADVSAAVVESQAALTPIASRVRIVDAMPKSGRSDLSDEQRADAERLRALFKERGPRLKLTQKTFAARFEAGTPSNVSQVLIGHRPLNAKMAAKFAQALRCNVADFSPSLARELKHLSASISTKAPVTGASGEPAPRYAATAPVRGIAVMDDRATWRWEDTEPGTGSVPWGGGPDSYAIQLHGDAMQPRYRSGVYAIVRESAPCDPDCDVLVVLRDGTAMVRELASKRDGIVVLRRLKDGERQTVAAAAIRSMHRVVGQVDASEFIATMEE